jgi:hypothetical protein
MEGNIDILNDSEPTADLPDDAEAVESEAPVEAAPETADRPRGPDGKFVSKGENEGASPAPQEEASEYEGKATIGERRRRQEAEARIAALEAQLQQFQQAQQQQPPPPAPDLWEDTPGWQQHVTQEIGNNAAQFAAMNARLDTSEMLARDKFDDFDEVKAKFLELAQSNPMLVEEAKADAHPWRKAYQIAKNHERMQSLGAVDVTSLEAKLREQIKAELMAEAQNKLPSAPPSISGDRSVASRSGPAWSGPSSISDLLS